MSLLRKAWMRGSAFDRSEPEAFGLSLEDTTKLSLADKRAKAMVRSWQNFDANAEIFSLQEHKRPLIADGVVGPATRKLAKLPRCPIPDAPPPENMDFSGLDDEMKSVFESYRQFNSSGSWLNCNPNSSAIHSIRINLDTSATPSVVRGYLNKALEAVKKAYADIGLDIEYVFDGEPLRAEIEKKWKYLVGGVIGWNEFPQANTCNQTISGRLDTSYTPSDFLLFASLECHETGHGVGLPHTRGGIMNPSILYFDPLSWRNDPSFSRLKRFFGGEPISEPSPTPSEPVNGTLLWQNEVHSFRFGPAGTIGENPNGIFTYDGQLFHIKIS